MLYLQIIFSFMAFFATSYHAFSMSLVSDEQIEKSIAETHVFKLDNGIPVIYKVEPSSDIIHINVGFDWGLKDQKPGDKSLPNLTTALMTRGSKKYPQESLFKEIEKYSLTLACASTIDTSSCAFETINDYFEKNIELLSSSVKEPVFTEKDLKTFKERMIASEKAEIEDPDYAVNQTVNAIYYEPTHPYVLTPNQAIKEIESYDLDKLYSGHKELLNAKRMTIAVVGSLEKNKLFKILNEQFGSIEGKEYEKVKVSYPKSSSESISLMERDIPTSYIKVKIPAPNKTSKDAVTAQLLFEILSEEMAVEIRTKRSLSYAAYAYTGQGQIGLGVFSVSTPKPKESLEVLRSIIEKMSTQVMGEDVFDEYKTSFSTTYFLRQETHGRLATTLMNSYYYYGDVKQAFLHPKKIAEVKPEEVTKLAKEILKNFKVGVLGNRKQVNNSLKGIL